MTTMALVRPDGRTYRSRSPGLRARAWENLGNYDEERCGVIVFGTLDPGVARQFARESCAYWYGEPDSYDVGGPEPGWYRDGFVNGERTWIADEHRGAPGVMFTWQPR